MRAGRRRRCRHRHWFVIERARRFYRNPHVIYYTPMCRVSRGRCAIIIDQSIRNELMRQRIAPISVLSHVFCVANRVATMRNYVLCSHCGWIGCDCDAFCHRRELKHDDIL